MKLPIILIGCFALMLTVPGMAQDDRMTDQQTAPQNQTQQDQRLNLNTQQIDQITGLQGQASRTGVYILRVPHRISNVTVGGISLPQAMIPTSTVSFVRVGDRVMVSADLFLLQNQVNPAIDAALNNGLRVTSLHDPFLWDSPRVALLHVQGTGSTEQLANAINRIVNRMAQRQETVSREMRESGTIESTCPEDTCYTEEDSGSSCPICGFCPSNNACPSENACPSSSNGETTYYRSGTQVGMSDGGMDLTTSGVNPSQSNLNRSQLQSVLKARPLMENGILKFHFAKSTSVGGQPIGWAMGVKSMANFSGSNDQALVTGDIAVYESELQGALRALRNANINILAIGNHMTNEQPRVLFIHFIGTGRASDLARGIRNALDVPAREQAPVIRQGQKSDQ